MKIVLYLSDKKREQSFHSALIQGFTKHGEQVEYVPRGSFKTEGLKPGADIAVFVGVKSRPIYQECRAQGVTTLLIDKGYFRNREYYRFALGDYQPPYLEKMEMPPQRMQHLGVRLRPRHSGNYVIYAGSSHKYCTFHGLGDVNDYARQVCANLNAIIKGEKTLIYRPKPSWWAKDTSTIKRISPDRDNLPANTVFSGPDELLSQLLPDAHCLVTHGSTAALDALAAGVPVLLLSEQGVSPAWYMSEHDMDNVLSPYWPSDAKRERLFANLAYCQFSVSEMASGFAWEHLKPWLNK